MVSDASGFFTYTIVGDQLCSTLEVADLTTPATGAHLHSGRRNVAGGVVVPLQAPTGTTGASSGCIAAKAEGGALTCAEAGRHRRRPPLVLRERPQRHLLDR